MNKYWMGKYFPSSLVRNYFFSWWCRKTFFLASALLCCPQYFCDTSNNFPHLISSYFTSKDQFLVHLTGKWYVKHNVTQWWINWYIFNILQDISLTDALCQTSVPRHPHHAKVTFIKTMLLVKFLTTRCH